MPAVDSDVTSRQRAMFEDRKGEDASTRLIRVSLLGGFDFQRYVRLFLQQNSIHNAIVEFHFPRPEARLLILLIVLK